MLLKNDTRLLPWQKSAEGREKVRLIHLFDELLVKSPESGLLSDWLYNKKKNDQPDPDWLPGLGCDFWTRRLLR